MGEVSTTVKDVSLSGAPLTVLNSYALSDRFLISVVARESVCGVWMAWCKSKEQNQLELKVR